MQTILEADCCLTCGSTAVYFQPNENRYMCNTCGHVHVNTGIWHDTRINSAINSAVKKVKSST